MYEILGNLFFFGGGARQNVIKITFLFFNHSHANNVVLFIF